jgi:subtilisin family serine protease
MSSPLPAWSWSLSDASSIELSPLFESLTWDRAMGRSTGAGVRVAVVDSGIDNDHPEIGGAVRGWVEPVVPPEDGPIEYRTDPHDDLFGHGTACAGIIHRIAPDAQLFSVRVLGRMLSGKAPKFVAGLRWALEHGMHVVNLSLSTTSKDYAGLLHELVDAAYYRRVVVVTAANNAPTQSYPSLYGVAVSAASLRGAGGTDPADFYCNPTPPVEFGAPGIDLRVAWKNGAYINATGNSFAAPHIAGLAALLLGNHPGLTPFEVKTALRALARNVRRDGVPPHPGEGGSRTDSAPDSTRE